MSRSKTAPAAFSLAASAVGWALAPIFIRHLSQFYDPHTQNALRYGSASIVMLFMSIIWFRSELRRAFFDWRALLGVAIVNIVQQHTWTVGCVGSTATTAQLISKLSIVFVIVFSFFLFREERSVIRSPWYIIGTLMSFVGVGAVISRNPDSVVPVFDVPTLMLFATAVLWAVYTVWGKHIVTDLHPVPMFTVISVYTTVGFCVMALFGDDPSQVVRAGWGVGMLGVVSGLIPIAVAHTCFHHAQKYLGSAFCSSIALFNPLLTYAIALWVFPDERLVATQWVGAGLLLGGTLLVIYAGGQVQQGK